MDNIIKILLLVFNFFILFPYILYKYKKSTSIALEVGLFFGIIGFYFIPPKSYDLYRYFNIFDDPKGMEYLYKNKIYIKFLVTLIDKLNISKHFISSISAVIQYYFLFKCFMLLDNKNKGMKNFLLILIFYQPLLFTGVRFGPAVSVFTYGTIMNIKNYKRGYVYILLSFFIHYALFIPAFIFIILKLLFKNVSLKQIKKIFLLNTIFLIYDFGKCIKGLLELMKRIFVALSLNIETIQNSLFYLKDKKLEINSGLFYNFNLYISLTIILYFCLRINNSNKKSEQIIFLKYILLLASFCIGIFSYSGLYFRYFIILNLLIILYLIKYEEYKINKNFYRFIYFFILIRYIVQFYENFELIVKSYF